MSSRVAIIGAGIAGLTTAYRLQQQGIDVTLYEARGRIGGRILTVHVADQIGELGGQNIYDGGEAKHLCRLIDETGLEIQHGIIRINRAYYTGKKLIPYCELFPYFDPDTLRQQLAELRKRSSNMFEVLSALFSPNDPAFKFLAVRLASYEGGQAQHLSSYYTETLFHMMLGGLCAAHQGNTIQFSSVKGGNHHLPEKLAEPLANRIHLNAPLTSMSKMSDGTYMLCFQDEQTTHADIVVLTIPCPVYADVHFAEDAIPPEILAAIRSIHYGTNAKILIPFSETPQHRMVLTNDRISAFFNSNGRLLTCYYTGKSSRFAANTINDTLNQDLSMLESGYSCSITIPPTMAHDASLVQYDDPIGYSWSNDPYVKGSYSYIAPGQDALLTTTSRAGEETVISLFAPIDHTLYFAGEHASILQEVRGTLEAACESGERAARMIAKRLSQKTCP